MNRLHERLDEQERREERQDILDWLSPIDFASQQHDFFNRHTKETGHWLLTSGKFNEWVS